LVWIPLNKENKVKRLTLFVSVMLALALVLPACGNRGPSTDLDVTMADFTFTPNTFSVPAGEEITFHAVNNGAVVHEFGIMNYGTSVGDDFDDEDEQNIYWEVETEVGQEVTTTFTAPTQPGEYEVVCGTRGHYQAGMVGTLTVVAGK
jgi:uncharacterized cupredoxin-like copper-binding protein